MVNVDEAYNTLETLMQDVESNRLQEIKEALALLGVDDELNMSDDELRNFWDTEINIDATTLEEKQQNALEKANELRDKLIDVATVYKTALSGFDFDTIDLPKSRNIAKRLSQANFDYMNSVSLKEYVKAVL